MLRHQGPGGCWDEYQGRGYVLPVGAGGYTGMGGGAGGGTANGRLCAGDHVRQSMAGLQLHGGG